MKRVLVTATVVVGVCALLFGCGSVSKAQNGKESSGVATSSVKSSPTKGAHAPKVKHPVDVEQYRFKPCTLLTERVRNSLEFGKPESRSTKIAAGKSAKKCTWTSSRSARNSDRLSVYLVGFGLEGQYLKEKQLSQFEISKSSYIAGYPAIYSKAGDKYVTDLTVGFNDHESVNIYSHSSVSTARSKEIADNVAVSMIRKARSGGN